MDPKFVGAAALAIALAACGNEADTARSDNLIVADNGGVTAPMANISVSTEGTSGQDYVNIAGAGDLYEIESARLAAEKAQRPEVRELAAMILADHQRSTAALVRAAGAVRPALAADPRMTPQQQADLNALRAASGAAFDTEYLRQQVAAHEQALALVENYAQNGDIPQLREHASTVSAPIRGHLERARELSAGA